MHFTFAVCSGTPPLSIYGTFNIPLFLPATYKNNILSDENPASCISLDKQLHRMSLFHSLPQTPFQMNITLTLLDLDCTDNFHVHVYVHGEAARSNMCRKPAIKCPLVVSQNGGRTCTYHCDCLSNSCEPEDLIRMRFVTMQTAHLCEIELGTAVNTEG